MKPTDILFWISGWSTVLWTVAEPGQFSEEINSSTQSAVRQTRRRASVHHRDLKDRSGSKLDSHDDKPNKHPVCNDRMVDSDSSGLCVRSFVVSTK